MTGVEYQKGRPPIRKGAGRGVFGKFLATRNDLGQFNPVIYCGRVKGIDNILNSNNRAVRTAIEKGVVNAMIEMLPKVAKRTGKMRRILTQAAQSVAAAQTTVLDGKIIIDVNQIKIMADAIEKYIKYHINPGSPFGLSYKEPFTKGTVPLSLFELHKKTDINIRLQLKLLHRNAGFDVI